MCINDLPLVGIELSTSKLSIYSQTTGLNYQNRKWISNSCSASSITIYSNIYLWKMENIGNF
jgi:hypothetical protein